MPEAVPVTGAAGFVGLAVTEALLARGDTAVAFDRALLPEAARAAFAALPGRIVPVEGDIRSAADPARGFAAAHVSRVLHAAVITAGAEREKRDAGTIVAVNVGGAVAVLEAAAAHRVARFVYPSSVAVYGQQPEGAPPFSEEGTWPRPVMLYGITKLAAEQALARLAREGEAANVITHVPFDRPPMDIARLRAALGWAPRFGLAEAAADALAFFGARPTARLPA